MKFDLVTLKMYLHTNKMNFLGQGFQKLEHYKQTDRHRTHHHAAFAGGNYNICIRQEVVTSEALYVNSYNTPGVENR